MIRPILPENQAASAAWFSGCPPHWEGTHSRGCCKRRRIAAGPWIKFSCCFEIFCNFARELRYVSPWTFYLLFCPS